MKARYCNRNCAKQGQKLHRTPWAKGKTKETDARLMFLSENQRRRAAENPTILRGANHPMFGKKHTEEARAKISEAQKGRKASPGALECLKLGQDYFRGKTAQTCPALASRGRTLSERTKGRPNPAHAERLRKYYAEHPEQHPNFVLAKKGHRTAIERKMEAALTKAGIPFEYQFRIGRRWADFALVEHRLDIEVDGIYWHEAERDATRDAEIRKKGWSVLRFTEEAVHTDLAACIETIREAITHLVTQSPS